MLGATKCKRKKKKESGTPTNAVHENHRTFRCGARPARRARPSAFHRGSCQRDASPQGSASGQASWDVVSTGVIRCLLSQSSGSTSRTGRNAGEHDARSRPGVAVTSRRPRAPRPVPISQGHRLTSSRRTGLTAVIQIAAAMSKRIISVRDCSNKPGCYADRIFALCTRDAFHSRRFANAISKQCEFKVSSAPGHICNP